MQNQLPLPLFKIPLDLWQPILNKVTPRTLCRLRQTCTSVDKFVINNRHRLNCRVEEKELILLVQITNCEKPALQFSVLEGRMPGDDHLDDFFHGRESTEWTRILGRIENPLDQLAGIHFNIILVDQVMPLLLDFEQPAFISQLEKQKAVRDNNAIPLLTKLRLLCDTLEISHTFAPAEIISLFRFARLSVRERIQCTGDFQQWPIQNCSEFNISDLEELPERLSSAVRMYEKVSIFTHSTDEPTASKVKQFLKEIARDRSALGSLKLLCINYEGDDFAFRMQDFPGVSVVWKAALYDHDYLFSIEEDDLAIYKFEISDGFVLILESMFTYELHIMPADTTRESMFDFLVQHIFPKVPIDASFFFADFMEADVDPAAFEVFDSAAFVYYENYEPKEENEDEELSEEEEYGNNGVDEEEELDD